MFFLGIDGGGTKTTCLVTDEGLNEIYRSVGSSVNFYSEGYETARSNMREMLEDIRKNTGVSHFDGVCIGSSALFGRADEKTKSSFCDGVFDCENIIMDSDLFIALKATERENAAVIIAGTGSMAAGKNSRGEIITRGGYGYILGDEGSGYRIALDGIHAAVRSLDGTGEYTSLGEMLLEFSGVKAKEELVDAFYSPEKDRKAIAAFSVQVSLAAEKGDGIALTILKKQAELLSLTAKALIAEMPVKPYLSLYGGVFQHSEIFRKHFCELVADAVSDSALMAREPVYGACIAARELCL